MAMTTIREVADQLQVTPQYVHRMIQKLDIKPERLNNRMFLLTGRQVQKIRRFKTQSKRQAKC